MKTAATADLEDYVQCCRVATNRGLNIQSGEVPGAQIMKTKTAQVMAFGRETVKWYIIISVLMFVGGIVAGAALALTGYALPQLF